MNKILVLLLILSLAGNAVMAVYVFQPQKVGKIQVTDAINKYPLLAKRIFIEDRNDVIINFISLRHSLRALADKEKGKMGIFFEYLPTGVTIGIHEKEGFRRASLVKVPTVMRAYKLIEDGRLSKKQYLSIKKKHLDKGFGKLYKNGAGAKITVEEAIDLILLKSDNTAYNVLRDEINDMFNKEAGSDNEILSVYEYLDIPKESDQNTLDISPKNFSSMLLSLYFSSYLSYESSNEILNIMSRRAKSFNMLSAAVPKEIKVADKFGVNGEGDNEIVTSDCGIVYIPKRPYILCVMVRDIPQESAGKIVAVSKTVYDFVSKAN